MTEPSLSRNRFAALSILLIPLAAAACNGDQQSSRRRPATLSASAPRAAAASGLIGGHDNRTRLMTGAGVVPIANADVADYLDRFERDLRAKTAGTGIDFVRRDNALLVTIPSRIA